MNSVITFSGLVIFVVNGLLREAKKMSQRIPGISLSDADARTSAVLNSQSEKWGSPLINHLVYARIPSIFKAVRGMWSGLSQSGLLVETLVVLVNRRVAILNNCQFWQDINAAVGSELSISDDKLMALRDFPDCDVFSEVEIAALSYADAMTLSDREVGDDLFAQLREHFNDNEIIELTEVIAWENASSKFNRALRIPSQGLWKATN